MGHSDDSISYSKSRVAATQHSNLTLPVRYPSPFSQSIPLLLVSGSPLKHNATDLTQDDSATHVYSQSRDAILSSAVASDSRYRSVRKSTGISSPVQIPGSLPNPNLNVLSQRQYGVFQAHTYPPTTVAPSYTATAQTYGDVRYASELRDRVGLPGQISGSVPNTNFAMDNDVLSQQQYKASQAPTYPLKTVAPSYTANAQSYGADTYASEPWDRISPPIQISGGMPDTNPAADNPVLSEQQCRAFQASTYLPTTVTPSRNTISHYGGDARHASGVGDASSPSSSSLCSFQDSYFELDVDLPTQASDGISGRYLMVDSVPSQQGFHRSINSSITLAPSYGGHTAQGYTDNTSHIPLPSNSTPRCSNSPARPFTGHSTCGLEPQFPLPSIPTTPISHLNALHQTPFAGHHYQAMIPREQGWQQPLSHASQVFIIDGCRIEGVDLADQASADGIVIGRCLRTDSPCHLWVKVDKRSLKRHLKRWHNFTRGGDSNKASCTWHGCDTAMQKSAIPRHTMRKHFNETFKCHGCDRYFTRYECWQNHAPKCELSNLGWTVQYGGGTRTIDVLGMSLSQGS